MSNVLFQRIERETTKSPAITGSRKKAAGVRSNGQITSAEPAPPTGKIIKMLDKEPTFEQS